MSKMKDIIGKIVPINRNEITKFMCIAGLILLITYIHSVLKISKDALVISHLGTETISAIKLYAGLPMSLLFMFVYIKLSDVFTRARLFHAMNWFFIAYFVLFATVLYPNGEALSIHISDSVVAAMPSFKYLFKMLAYWHYCLFYCFSESWVTIMLSISFWQTANHITNIDQSKRFYPLFGIVAQIGLFFAGYLAAAFAVEGSDWQPALNSITMSIVAAGVGISGLLFAIEKTVGVENFNSKQNLNGTPSKKPKAKLSFGESLKYIASSKPILLIASLLLCYNISINLVEGIWKKSIEVMFSGNANQVQHYLGGVNVYISIFSIVCAFAGIYIVRHCKWRTSALITPIAILVTGAAFFLFMLLKDSTYLVAYAGSALGILGMGIFFGSANNVFARSTKHTLFDSTKEMVYIPLDDELKTKGKAAAETIGMRFGKGSGAFIQQVLLGLFPAATLMDLSPIISGIFLALLVGWILATINLSKLFDKA